MRFVYGLDVSGYDQLVDWPKLKAMGLTFAFIKSSEGLGQDSAFATHWPLAKTAGFLRSPYHFYTQASDPLAQAQFFTQVTQADPGELPPIVDVEHEKTPAGGAIPIANPVKYMAHLHTLLAAVEIAFKRPPLLYTAWRFWHDVTLKSGGPPAWAAHYPLWIANYPNALFGLPNLALPAAGFQSLVSDIEGGVKYRGFPALAEGFKTYKFWQFSAEKYFLDGLATLDDDQNVIQAPADLDLFPGSEADLRAWAGLPPAVDGPDPVSVPTGIPDLPPAGPAKTVPHITNQAMINAFARAFGADFFWDIIVAAGLESMAIPTANRTLRYSGPAIEDLPLTPGQKTALIQALP